MSIKITIERKFKEALMPEHLRAIEELRIKALRQKGYIGGETVVNFDDNREVLVLSAWSSLDDWKTWISNQERVQLENELASHLKEPVRIRAFMSSADYAKKAFA